MIWIDFDDIWQKYSEDSRIEFACFGFHVRFLIITLSSQTAYRKLLSTPFLATLEMPIFVNNPRNWWSMDPRLTWNFSWLWGLSSWLQRHNCVDVFISMRTASAAAQTPVDYSVLHQQPVDAVLCPTFVQKLCYKLSSVVTFTFLQTFD